MDSSLVNLALTMYHDGVVRNRSHKSIQVRDRLVHEADPAEFTIGWGDSGDDNETLAANGGRPYWLYVCMLNERALWRYDTEREVVAQFDKILNGVANGTIQRRFW